MTAANEIKYIVSDRSDYFDAVVRGDYKLFDTREEAVAAQQRWVYEDLEEYGNPLVEFPICVYEIDMKQVQDQRRAIENGTM